MADNAPTCKIIRSEKRKLSDFIQKLKVLDGSTKQGICEKLIGVLDGNERGKIEHI